MLSTRAVVRLLGGLAVWSGCVGCTTASREAGSKPVAPEVGLAESVDNTPAAEAVMGSGAFPTREVAVSEDLSHARFWLLDVNNTFGNARQRHGAWLISLVGIAEPDAPEGKLAEAVGATGTQSGEGLRLATPSELAAIEDYRAPPATVWILSEHAPPCSAKVNPSPRVDFYADPNPSMELAHALSGCEWQGVLDIAVSEVRPAPELRFRPATTEYDRDPAKVSNSLAPWSHPLSRFLVAQTPPPKEGGPYAPPEQTITLLGVGSRPPLLDLLTGIVLDHAPVNPDEYNACLAHVETHHELGVLEGDNWTSLPLAEERDVHLEGALMLGERVAAVVGSAKTRAQILPMSDAGAGSWTTLTTGIYHDEVYPYADRQLGPYCGP